VPALEKADLCPMERYKKFGKSGFAKHLVNGKWTKTFLTNSSSSAYLIIISRVNKRTAGKYIFASSLSDYTKRLYKSVLKAFCEWVLEYQLLDSTDLSKEQKTIKRGLKK
jgi:hypothetical protein